MGNTTSRITEENWKSFKSALNQAIIKHVPTTKSQTKRNLPWITWNIKCEIREKDRQYILSDTNGLHITSHAKTRCLNRLFVSVFTNDDGRHLPDKGPSPNREMDTIQFTQPGIEILLKNIDQTRATGPDELPARIQKESANEIAGVLSVIFQQSHEIGTIPFDWSTARISAIYKKGDKAHASNYRPVSLTCITCKIMENNIICSQIGRHLDHSNILHPNQRGFRKGLS